MEQCLHNPRGNYFLLRIKFPAKVLINQMVEYSHLQAFQVFKSSPYYISFLGNLLEEVLYTMENKLKEI